MHPREGPAMSDRSGILWTDATWNVVIGCDKVSPGCFSCYAIRTAHRMAANPNPKIAAAYSGVEAGGEWTGQINLIEERLEQPLRWAKPRKIFVNAQSDLYHRGVDRFFLARVFAVMAVTPRHTYQILTKRPGRMHSLMRNIRFQEMVSREVDSFPAWQRPETRVPWPLPNVWQGVSVEDQRSAEIRIPVLRATPAAVRFLSCEPLLAPVDLLPWLKRVQVPACDQCHVPGPMDWQNGHLWGRCRCACHPPIPGLDWVIVGGESGPNARPMAAEWVRALRDQCAAAGTPFLFKQWGGLTSNAGGRELDGRTWDQYPTTTYDASTTRPRHARPPQTAIGPREDA